MEHNRRMAELFIENAQMSLDQLYEREAHLQQENERIKEELKRNH